MANFFETVQNNEQMSAHELEIQQSRVGGLGGSDAAMVLRVAERGLAGLTQTDTKRLCVMLGLMPVETWGGNAYTNAGHKFEDFAEQHLPVGCTPCVRERLMDAQLSRKMRIFAHADFAWGNELENVIECKFVQKPTSKVLDEYEAQLQWYYMLGAKSVTLYHGTGSVEPFDENTIEADVVEVERDCDTIDMLLAGIRLLDEALESGWLPTIPDRVQMSDTPAIVQNAIGELERIKTAEADLKKQKNDATAVVKSYIEAFGYTGIACDGKRQVIYTKASTSKTFDADKFLQDHPEYKDAAEYWKETERKSSITYK